MKFKEHLLSEAKEKPPISLHPINQALVNQLWQEIQDVKAGNKGGKWSKEKKPPIPIVKDPLVDSLWDELQQAKKGK